ncbi:hypothetical protein PAMP_001353 [Pampus punctatissimus]
MGLQRNLSTRPAVSQRYLFQLTPRGRLTEMQPAPQAQRQTDGKEPGDRERREGERWNERRRGVDGLDLLWYHFSFTTRQRKQQEAEPSPAALHSLQERAALCQNLVRVDIRHTEFTLRLVHFVAPTISRLPDQHLKYLLYTVLKQRPERVWKNFQEKPIAITGNYAWSTEMPTKLALQRCSPNASKRNCKGNYMLTRLSSQLWLAALPLAVLDFHRQNADAGKCRPSRKRRERASRNHKRVKLRKELQLAEGHKRQERNEWRGIQERLMEGWERRRRRK